MPRHQRKPGHPPLIVNHRQVRMTDPAVRHRNLHLLSPQWPSVIRVRPQARPFLKGRKSIHWCIHRSVRRWFQPPPAQPPLTPHPPPVMPRGQAHAQGPPPSNAHARSSSSQVPHPSSSRHSTGSTTQGQAPSHPSPSPQYRHPKPNPSITLIPLPPMPSLCMDFDTNAESFP